MATKTDLEIAFKAITGKRMRLDTLFSYVNGGQPLKYSTERLKETFDNIKVHFEINWCSVIVDATLDRLELNGFDTEDQAANDLLDNLFDRLHIGIQADDAHKAALSMGNAYIIVWKQTDGQVEIYYNDPRICHVVYENTRPNVKRFAAKMFCRDDGHTEMTLYYLDRLEHYVTRSDKGNVDNVNDFQLESTEPNTFGVIPVFELRTSGEIDKVITLQDAINKTFADMMVAAEFGAFTQRYIISNSDPSNLKNAPNEIWWIPSGEGVGQAASVGQFQSTDLGNYLDAMDKLANSMAIISRTPKHYLMTTGANISGEALLAMETPLTRKAEKHQQRFNTAWQDVAQFILQLSGITLDANAITPVWKRVESIQPFIEAQANQISINMGIPLITILRRQGWTEQEIQTLEDDRKNEKASQRSTAQAVLDTLRVEDAQSNAPVT